MLLTKEQILSAQDLPTEDVSVPEWGGSVRVRGMTGSERDAWELLQLDEKKPADIRATLVAFTLVDEKGALLFTPAEISALGKKSAKALQRVFRVAQKLSRITEADVKELEKNSSGAPEDASPSSSPAN